MSYSPSSEAVLYGKKREDITQCKIKNTVNLLTATGYPVPTCQNAFYQEKTYITLYNFTFLILFLLFLTRNKVNKQISKKLNFIF